MEEILRSLKLVLVVIALVLCGCTSTNTPTPDRAITVGAVVFEVENDELKIITPSLCEPEFPTDSGCLRAPRGGVLNIKLVLTGKQDSTSACKINSPSHHYVLDGMQIRGKSPRDKPDTKPVDWDSETAPLDREVLNDFDVIDPKTGWLDVKRVSNNGKISLHVIDRNESESGYLIWYRVRARCNDPSMADNDPALFIYSDPRIDNLGKKTF